MTRRRFRTHYTCAVDLAYEAQVAHAAGDRETAMTRYLSAWRGARESVDENAAALVAHVEQAIRDAGGTVPYVFDGIEHGPYLPRCRCTMSNVVSLTVGLCEFCAEMGAARQAARNEANVTDGRLL